MAKSTTTFRAISPGGGSSSTPVYSTFRLVLISLFLAIFVWLLAKKNEFDTDIVDVPVRLANVPIHLNASHDPDQLQVSLRFPRGLRAEMLSSNFAIDIDAEVLRNLETNALRDEPIVYPIKPANFKVLDQRLPQDTISLLRFVPEAVQINVSYHGEKALIEPRVEGTPARGYNLERNRLSVHPKEIFVTGSPEALRRARDPQTGRIVIPTSLEDLEGVRESSLMYPELRMPAGLRTISPDDATVEMTIVITEEIVERTFTELPITIPVITKIRPRVEPATSDVTVRGPRSLIDALRPGHFKFLVGRSLDESPGASNFGTPLEVRLGGRPGDQLEGRESELTIKEISPPQINVSFPENQEPAP